MYYHMEVHIYEIIYTHYSGKYRKIFLAFCHLGSSFSPPLLLLMWAIKVGLKCSIAYFPKDTLSPPKWADRMLEKQLRAIIRLAGSRTKEWISGLTWGLEISNSTCNALPIQKRPHPQLCHSLLVHGGHFQSYHTQVLLFFLKSNLII